VFLVSSSSIACLVAISRSRRTTSLRPRRSTSAQGCLLVAEPRRVQLPLVLTLKASPESLIDIGGLESTIAERGVVSFKTSVKLPSSSCHDRDAIPHSCAGRIGKRFDTYAAGSASDRSQSLSQHMAWKCSPGAMGELAHVLYWCPCKTLGL
jgi:hypothetical protein